MIKRLSFFLLFLCAVQFAFTQVNAAFTLNQTSGCPNPFLLIASDNSTGPGAPTSRVWTLTGPPTPTQPAGYSFGSLTAQLSTTLQTPGLYTITLTICYGSGNCDTETQTDVIEVFARPTVAMTYGPLLGCPPHQVCFDGTFTAGCGTIVSSLIDTKDGTVYSNIADVCHTYVNSGTYDDITVSVTNSCGCITTTTVNTPITVSPAPVANFTNTPPTSCTSPLNVIFTNTSTNTSAGTTYEWSIPGVTLANPNAPSFTSNFTTGNYSVQLIVTNPNTCADTLTRSQLIAVGNPIADFTSNLTTICPGGTINFTNLSSPSAISQTWVFEGHGTSNVANPSNTFVTPGTWDVTLTSNYAGGCSDNITIPNYVTVTTQPVNNYTVSNATGCAVPFTTSFTNTSVGADTTTWSFPGGTPSTFTGNGPISVTYNTLGNSNITMTSTSTEGCAATTTFPNAIILTPLSVQALVGNSNGCIPVTPTLTYILSSGQIAASQNWTLPGSDIGSSTAANPIAVYNTVGCNSLTLSVTTTTGCVGSTTLPSAVCAGAPSSGSFSVTPTVLCFEQEDVCVDFTGAGGSADTILWDFGDSSPPQFASDDATVCHSYSDDLGDYTITMIPFQFGCPGDTIAQIDVVEVLGPIAAFSSNFVSCTDWNTFNFTDESEEADSVYYTFGDPSTTLDFSSLPDPQWIYPAIDSIRTYTITQFAFNFTTGCDHQVSSTITVFPPNASFTATPTAGCGPLSVSLVNNSFFPGPGGDTRWNWDSTFVFGGSGSNSVWNTQPSRVKVYPNEGIYTIIMLNIDNRGCRDTIVQVNLIEVNRVFANFTRDVSAGCAPLAVQFTDLSTAPLTGVASWFWNFGDLGTLTDTSSLQNPSYLFTNAGTYQINLTATDSFGCTSVFTQTVQVNGPLASFSVSDTFLCTNQALSFSNQSTGNGLSYNWQFSNAIPNSSILSSPLPVSFTTEAFQTMFLEVTDLFGCSDDTTLTIPVFDVLADANASNDSINCFANVSPISFTNTSLNNVDPTSVFWDLGNGVTSNLMNPSAIYNVAGNYVVTMSISSNSGCRDTVIVDTIFVGGPFASIEIIGRDTACICETINFEITTWNTANPSFISGDGGLVSYVPDGLIGDTIIDTIAYQYCQAGSFAPQVFIDDGTCSGVVLLSDTVRIDSLIADFSVGNISVCDSGIVCFYDSSFNFIADTLGIVLYTWDFGDGNISNLENPCHLYIAPGFYDVSLTVLSNFNCEETLVQQIYIPASPVVSIAQSDSNGCLGLSLLFWDSTSVDTNTFIQSWAWNFGDTTVTTDVSSLQDASYVYNNAGFFTTTLTVVDTFGCSTTDSVIIEVFPLSNIVAGPDVLLCNNDSVQISASGGASYSWVPNYNITNDSIVNPFVFPITDTTYIVEGIDVNGCPNWDTLFVDVNQISANFSSISVCLLDTNFFLDLSTTDGLITSWTWDFNDPASGVLNNSILQNPNHFYDTQGSFDVSLSIFDSNLCQSDTVIQVFVLDAPVASFTGDSVCLGNPTSFNSNSSTNGGAIFVDYQWDFGVSGDNTDTSNIANPSYTYTASGEYTVCLTVTTDQACAGNTDDVCFVVQVYDLPNASFTIDSACFGNANSFTDLSIIGDNGIATSLWDFGQNIQDTLLINGAPASTQFIYSTFGQYVVSLSIIDSNACESSATGTAFLFANPVADFSFITACQNQDNLFVSLPLPGTSTDLSYYWDFDEGAGFILGDSLQDYSFNFSGNHNVIHVIQDGLACSDTIIQAINIVPAPTAVITGDNTVCRGTSTNLSGASSTVGVLPLTYSWNISTSQTSAINYSPNADNIVRLTVTDGNGCFDTTSLFIDVLERPDILMDWTDACEDLQFNISSNVDAGDAAISAYNWTLTSNSLGVSTFSTQDVNFLVPNIDTLSVSLVVVDANNCSDSTFQTIIVDEQAVVNVLISEYLICPNDSLIINLNNPAQFTVSGLGSVSWSPSFGLLSDANSESVVLSPSTTTTYTLVANSALGQCPQDDDNVINVEVAPNPFITVEAVPNPVLVGAISNISAGAVPFNVITDSILWDNSSGTLNTNFGFNLEATPLEETAYPFQLVYYVDSLRCVKDTSITLFVITECNGEIIYTPNIFTPNDDGKNDEFKITGYGIEVISFIRIFDRWGQLMFEGTDIEMSGGRMNNGTGWQGDNQGGQDCNSGVYVYTYELICANNDIVRGSGNVTLIK
jgi:gliding motility-associated-like protein